jgi:hypothetical protein
MNLTPRKSRDGRLVKTADGWRLGIPAGGASRYRVSQLDDQVGLARRAYAWQPPLEMSLRARVSTPVLPGTWGFGLWNDPYGFSFGPGERFLRFPALPQTAWFFGASPKSYLSFRDDKPANGFFAQSLGSPRHSASLIPAALALPVAPKATRRILSRVINEDAAAVRSDPSQWHTYRIQWMSAGTSFWIDDALVLESAVSPAPPLGLVVWIDNQHASFDPRGRISWGMEANPEDVWLEVESLQVEAG